MSASVPPASFVVVANRLPVEGIPEPDGSPGWRVSPGGLVAALGPVMQRNRGTWVGWTGTADEKTQPFEAEGMRLVPVGLTSEEVADYYEGFSNATLWPLYHDLAAVPQFHRPWWDAYREVNRRFAGIRRCCRGERSDGVGAGLPAAAGPRPAAGLAARFADRILQPHSFSRL